MQVQKIGLVGRLPLQRTACATQSAAAHAAQKSCSFRPPVLSSVLLHILPKCSINLRLITFFERGLRFEPSDHIGVYAKGQLSLHRPVEKSALGARPVEQLWSVRPIDGIVGQGCKRPQFCQLFRLRRLKSSLLHILSFHVPWLSAR